MGKKPSPVIAKLLQDLPWMCKNYKNECRESKINEEDLKYHQQKCIYRKVSCPNCSGSIIFKDVIEHLKTCMDEPMLEEKMVDGERNKFISSIDIDDDTLRSLFEERS